MPASVVVVVEAVVVMVVMLVIVVTHEIQADLQRFKQRELERQQIVSLQETRAVLGNSTK
jgi:energy-converting hydrogenase Eha subunit H